MGAVSAVPFENLQYVATLELLFRFFKRKNGAFVLTVEPGIRTVTARHAGYLSAQAVITAMPSGWAT